MKKSGVKMVVKKGGSHVKGTDAQKKTRLKKLVKVKGKDKSTEGDNDVSE